MRAALLTLVLTLSSQVLAHPHDPRLKLQDAVASIDRAIAALRRIPSGPAQRVAMRELLDARSSVVHAIEMADFPPPPNVLPPERKVLPAAPGPMAEADFADLLARLKQIAFGNDRVEAVKDAARHNRFTSDQVSRVIALFSFGSEQVEAAAAMYPRVIDKKNFFKVIAELEFESDREELRRRVEQWDKAGLGGGQEVL